MPGHRWPRLLLCISTTAACSHAARIPAVTVSAIAPESAAARVFLVGDAGAPADPVEPVLEALREDVARSPSQSLVVFLGDNLYPRGLPDSAEPARWEGERRLRDQVDAAVAEGGRAILVPGNHDWDRMGPSGWDKVRLQGRFVDTIGQGRARMLPRDGCPGPVVEDLEDLVRIIILDTQWWLHGGPKPTGSTTECGDIDVGSVTDRIRMALRSAGERSVVVVAHHPLVTGGQHGGHFSILRHIFPLRDLNASLWIPLPVIGSLYPFARQSGVSSQDLSSGAYGALVDSLRAAFRVDPPLLYAAGHEHSLQVFQGEIEQFSVVSGSGYWGNGGLVHWIDGTRFASSEAGYMRLDVMPDRRVRLEVRVVDDAGYGREVFSMWIRGDGRR